MTVCPPPAPCHALCSMLSGMNEHGNRSAIAILIAIAAILIAIKSRSGLCLKVRKTWRIRIVRVLMERVVVEEDVEEIEHLDVEVRPLT